MGLVNVNEMGKDGTVIVWPSGTTVAGSGESLSVTSQGVTVRIGDEIDAGTTNGPTFPEFEGGLPDECAGSGLMDIHLGG